MKSKKKKITSLTMGKKRKEGAEFPVAPLRSVMPSCYASLIDDIKSHIQQARLRAATVVNHELLTLYYSLGYDLDCRLREEEWGSGIIDRISEDLRKAFPEMDGLSPRNLRRMRAFYREYCGNTKTIRPRAVAKLPVPKWPPLVAKLSWAHNVINKPIGVASFETQIVSKLPKHLKSSLPTIDEIEAELKDVSSVVKPKGGRRG